MRAIGLLGFLAGVAAAHAEPLNEAEVIRLAKARHPRALAARAAVAVAEAGVVRAGLHPNPSLGWSREHLPVAPGAGRVDDLLVTLPIELSGRRWAAAALARSEVATAGAWAARTQSESVAAALELFHDALAASAEVELITRAVGRLDEAARVMERMQQAGATSGYERARLELEAELARSLLRQAGARAGAARAALASLLGIEQAGLELKGELTPASPGPAGAAGPRRSIDQLRSAEEAAGAAQSAADWSWVPALFLTGGLRIEQTDATRYGYVAGVSLALPVFSSGQEVRAETSARQKLAVVERQSAERSLGLAASRAEQQLAAAVDELRRFDAATRERVERLERAAESGYREGERTMLELVDAQRARLDVERRRLELQLAAKRAEVALRSAGAEFE